MRGSLAWILGIGLIAVVTAAVAWWVFPGKLGSIDTTGTLDTCMTGEPVVTLDGDWRDALPADVRSTAPTYLPLYVIYSDWNWDWETRELTSADSEVMVRVGDLVHVSGRIVEVHGDPSPCNYTLNLKLGDLKPQ